MKKNLYVPSEETKSQYLARFLSDKRKMGKVHSVFKTSFNIMVDGDLINFSSQGMTLSAYGCILNQETMKQLVSAAKPGDLVRVQGEHITFYTIQEVLEVDLSEIGTTDLSIPDLQLSQKEITQTGMYAGLDSFTFAEKIGLKNEKQTQATFQTLQTLPQQDEKSVEEAVVYLIGRGQGLTPSGDDMLLGYTMVRKAFNRQDSFDQIVEKALKDKSTTDISAAHYQALLAGYVSSLFISLILNVETATKEEVNALIKNIGRYGHTSGYDTLFGFYLGLQSLASEVAA